MGYTTTIGQQIQQYMDVPTHYCGYVLIEGVVLPPPPKKWGNFRLDKKHYIGVPGTAPCGLKTVYDIDPETMTYEPHFWPNGYVRVPLRKIEKRKPRLMLCGFAIAGATPVVSAICQHNIAKALLGRVFRTPRHVPQAESFQVARAHLDALLANLFTPTEIMPFREWVDAMPTKRKIMLIKARAELRQNGFHPRTDGKFNVFVKSEKLCGHVVTTNGLEPLQELMDRIIQAPSDIAHVIAGPPLKTLTHKLKSVWHWRNHIFYASVSADVLQQWTRRVSPRGRLGVCVDYTQFDATHSLQSWLFVEEIYRRAGICTDPDFVDLLQVWRRPQGAATGNGWAVKYAAPEMNASGRDDTSLVNAILNGVVIFLSLTAAYFRIDVSQLNAAMVQYGKENFDIAVVGDDSLAYVPPLALSEHEDFARRLSANIATFGLDAAGEKIQLGMDVHDQVFLGMRMYEHDGDLIWGRTVGRALFKLGWKCAPMPADPGAHMAGEALAIILTQNHVPILSDFCRAYLAWWGNGKITHVRADDEEHKPWRDVGPRPDYNASTVRQFCITYGLTHGEFDSTIALIRSLDRFPCVVSSGALLRIIQRDDC